MTSGARHPGIARRLARAGLLGAGVAVAVTGIAFLVRAKSDAVLTWDHAAIRSATDLTRAHPGLRQFLLVVQEVMQPRWVYIVMTGVCLWVWRRGLRSRAWWAFATMMIGWNLALLVKLLVRRARPVVEDAVSHAPGYSFPSGHAANAAIGMTALVVLLWPFVRDRGPRIALVAGAAAVVVVTCLDRVYLGVHFPSDVTAGVLLGTGLILASYAGYLDWNPGSKDPHTDPDTSPKEN